MIILQLQHDPVCVSCPLCSDDKLILLLPLPTKGNWGAALRLLVLTRLLTIESHRRLECREVPRSADEPCRWSRALPLYISSEWIGIGMVEEDGAMPIPYQSKPYQTTERCPYPALSRTPSLDTRQLSPADSLRQPVPLNHSTKHGWEHQTHTHTHTHRHKDTYTIHKQPVPVTKHVWEHGGEIWTGCRKHLAFFDHQSSHQSQSSRQRIHFSSENQRLSEISKMRRMESRAVVKC